MSLYNIKSLTFQFCHSFIKQTCLNLQYGKKLNTSPIIFFCTLLHIYSFTSKMVVRILKFYSILNN